MSNYRDLLALEYFKNTGKNYSLQELSRILGLTVQQLDELIYKLKSQQYIAYVDYELEITNKGITKLIANDFYDNEEHEILTKEKMNIWDIYIPENFEKKI